MIFPGTQLKVADNSGAKVVNCIQPVGRSWAGEGDLVIVSVRRARSGKAVAKGKVYAALVVQCRKGSRRPFGHGVRFRSNRVVLLRRNDGRRREIIPLGTRVTKVVSFALRRRGYAKVLLLSPGQL
jgi:large subunit ribosomal protein L14